MNTNIYFETKIQYIVLITLSFLHPTSKEKFLAMFFWKWGNWIFSAYREYNFKLYELRKSWGRLLNHLHICSG